MTALTTALPSQTPGTTRGTQPLGSARVTPLDALRHTATLAWRTLVQVRHNPMELLDFSVQPLMFLLLFTYVFGGAISGSTGDYLTFALPGIIVQNTLFTTLNTGTGLNTDLTKGVFDRLRSLPIARSAPLAGRILADMTKQLWAIAMLLGLGYILGFRVQTGPLQALAAVGLVVLFALAASWISVLVGMLVSEPEKVMVFGFTLIFPLTFVSNAFVQTFDHARLAAGVRQGQSGHRARRRHPRPARLGPGLDPDMARAAVGRGPGRGVRAAGGDRVQAAGLTGTRTATAWPHPTTPAASATPAPARPGPAREHRRRARATRPH
ncbi:Putative ABC-transporter transmembrane component; putative membrane protein [Frankia alni ACN14a]|uniref:ABC-transporter transmembrane component putative membrane protein n=1 Tax=Frankia alni (strain DSM 45986 / CECT 9034 / ACN14a) TaxID=326424 RepID=Q0REE9_FRAAA|nr:MULTISPECIES: ABC transporter permease [Frankia]CAJ64161.1 Putative ABC-transporter transmembrane component; putative membrane protein [Frankia alni ACN14a]